jgi:hypothetical protein
LIASVGGRPETGGRIRRVCLAAGGAAAALILAALASPAWAESPADGAADGAPADGPVTRNLPEAVPPAAIPPAAPSSDALQQIKQELQALEAEEAAAKLEQQKREQRIDALAQQLSDASGEPIIRTAAAAPEKVEKPKGGLPVSEPEGSTPGEGYWGKYDGGTGFTVAKTDIAQLNISGYLLGRYINQIANSDTFVDHLGQVRPIDPRNDIQLQRAMVWFRGWLFDPKFRFDSTLWTVNSTEQIALIGMITYEFNDAFTLGVGVNRMQGSLSMHFSHPFWNAPDRVMADEFFRPGFVSGLFALGEPIPGLRYMAMIGPALGQLGVNAAQFTRDYAYSGSVWWMPTTHEFGPREAFGDFEDHKELATLFSVASAYSPKDDRFDQPNSNDPDNNIVRTSDSLNFYGLGALAPGVTVQHATYFLASAAAGFKYHGWAAEAEGYYREMSNIHADGPIPIERMIDTGFYVQSSYMVLPKTLEIYGATSQIYGQFNSAFEYLVGMNYYPFHVRNARINAQVIDVNHSPVSSLFGYYVGGMTGTTVSVAMDVMY